MTNKRIIGFDWALKKLLRSRANYEVLEGFLSELLKDDIEILEILEDKSQTHHLDNFNRADLKVENQKGEIMLIEVQYERAFDFLYRLLSIAPKAIVEYMAEPDIHENITRVIFVNILCFDLGRGRDYVYHGATRFVGIHYHDELLLNDKQQQYFGRQSPREIDPEYYLLKINQFDDVARDTLDEWIYFLKNEEIKDGFRARGLSRAKEVLDVMNLSEKECRAYEWHIEEVRYQISMDRSRFLDGRFGGLNEELNEGRAEGKAEAKRQFARMMKQNGEPLEKIMAYTQLTLEEIADL
uniref:Rpn family recombination-promoting nuclease/putative transposase n=1 Tax=Candidatus Kentrum sp. LPFa TaxID=2126335 RepID=A0A450X3X1_9GAMM|nr:MAG: conserved hypothetical protein (putative transposase or invertase) [Candidatus Kentron sp. LPFa]